MGPDRWLENIHTLLSMDDTVVFGTSRGCLKITLISLKNCTDSIGMEIQPSKSQFLAVGCSDKSPFHVGNTDIYNTE